MSTNKLDIDLSSLPTPPHPLKPPEHIYHKSNGKRNYDDLFDAWMERMECTEPARIFCEGAFQFMVATALRRNSWVPMGNDHEDVWPANQYIMLVGVSGNSRKSTAIKAATKILKGAHIHLGPSQSTPEALYKFIATSTREPQIASGIKGYQASCLGLVAEECQTLIDFTSPSLAALLTAWYDSAYGWMHKQTIVRAREGIFTPCVSILAATTQRHFKEHIGRYAMENGVLNRFTLIQDTGKHQSIPQPTLHPKFEACMRMIPKITEDIDLIARTLGGPRPLTKAAQDLVNDYYYSLEKVPSSQDEYGLNARKPVKLLKHAQVFSAGQAGQTHITRQHIERALDFLKRCATSAVSLYRSNTMNEEAGFQNEIFFLLATSQKGLRKDIIIRTFSNSIPMRTVQDILRIGLKEGLLYQEEKSGRPIIKIREDLKQLYRGT